MTLNLKKRYNKLLLSEQKEKMLEETEIISELPPYKYGGLLAAVLQN